MSMESTAKLLPGSTESVNSLECPQFTERQICKFGPGIIISRYAGESQLPAIMELMRRDLSEPYSVFTCELSSNPNPVVLLAMAIVFDKGFLLSSFRSIFC